MNNKSTETDLREIYGMLDKEQLINILVRKWMEREPSNNIGLDLDTFTNQRVFRVRITKSGEATFEEKSATAAWCMGWIVEQISSPVLNVYKGGTISIIDTRTGLPIYEKAI